MTFIQKTQLKIFYLFMNADGEITASEKALFASICKKMGVDRTEKQELIKSARENLSIRKNSDNSEAIIQEIDSIIGSRGGLFFLPSLDRDKNAQAFVLWTLLNLAYADEEFSDPEKAVVNHLIDRWNTDTALVAELYDTLDTILALTNMKKSLQSSGRSDDAITADIRKIDKDIKLLSSNIEVSISEADIELAI